MDGISSFCYKRSELDENCTKNETSELSEFDHLILNQWKSAMQQGRFRYTLDHVKTRLIPGKKQFIAQFNDMRTTKRRKPSPITNIRQPFNPETFNFTKIQAGEILFKLSNQEDGKAKEDAENLIIINDSPVDVGHILFIPRIKEGLPQILTEDALQIAVDMMLLSNHRGFRVCWNSLGALASVNHLHFHAFYLDYPLLGEKISAKPLTSNGCYEITEESTRGFIIQLHGQTVECFTRLVFKVSSYMIDQQIPHNICITRGDVLPLKRNCEVIDHAHNDKKSTIRVLLWPKKAYFGTKPQFQDYEDNPPFLNSCIEPAGFLVIKDYASFNDLAEEQANTLLGKSSLEEAEFTTLKEDLCQYLEGSN